MTSTVLELASFGGAAILLWQPEPQFWITVAAIGLALVKVYQARWISNREDARQAAADAREDKRRKYEKEDRDRHREELKQAVQGVADIASRTKNDLQNDIAHNTAITQESQTLNIAAIEAGNHVTQKLQAIAEGAAKGAIVIRSEDTGKVSVLTSKPAGARSRKASGGIPHDSHL